MLSFPMVASLFIGLSRISGFLAIKRLHLENFLLLLAIPLLVLGEEAKLLSTYGSLPTSEYDALYDLYEATNGEYWDWKNITTDHSNNITIDSIPWNFTVYDLAAPCSNNWQGITCGCEKGSCHVQQLYLPSYNLSGTLPSTIGDFPLSTELNLGLNNITGTLPEEITNLALLEILDLHGNQIEGSLPSSIGNLSALTSLLLWYNFFDGTLPSSIYDCKKLIFLEIQYNLFEGSLSSSIENWTNLTILKVSGNKFTGSLPHKIGKLQNLTSFVADLNDFHGTIPPELYSLSRAKLIDLSFNNFTGTLAPEIGNLTSLLIWACGTNSLSGTLPDAWFTSSVILRTVDLEDNMFSGSINLIPNWKSSIQSLLLHQNSFTGTISKDFNQIDHLVQLDVSNNFLHGNTTELFLNLTSLSSLYLAHNSLTSEFPASLKWIKLLNYVLSGNYLTGTFPTNFSNSHFLYYLDVGYNHLQGRLPQYFNDHHLFPRLSLLNFSNNYFSGGLENTFENITSLVSLCLSYNQLTGPIPLQYSLLTNLYYLLIDNNQLTGTLSSSFSLITGLKILFLQNNQITGTISDKIKWDSLQVADLSNNLLTGSIPLFFIGSPVIEVFDASTNCFHGTIPKQLCNATSLTIICLDGLSTAKSCRSPIFPGINVLTSFILEDNLEKGIPECLFSMPNLVTLHLSGNGLTGSLPNDVEISDSLSDLTLSHNTLIGKIPSRFQERSWDNLDLSYNKFRGFLLKHIASYSSNQSLSLQVNRLSGNIPNTLISATDIDILDGNMFACNYDREHLPAHDPNVSNYSCGSDVVNAVLYMWIGFITCFILFRILIRRYFKKRKIDSTRTFLDELMSYIATVATWRQTFINRFSLPVNSMTTTTTTVTNFQTSRLTEHGTRRSDMLPEYHRICKLSLFLRKVRFVFCILTIYLFIILLPVYAALAFYYQTFQEGYAWELSALVLSGRSPAIILIAFFLLTILLLVVLFKVIISPSKSRQVRINSNDDSPRFSNNLPVTARRESQTLRESNENRSTARDISGLKTGKTSELSSQTNPQRYPRSEPKEQFMKISYLSLAIVGFWNCLMMILADVIYVYVIFHSSTFIITLAEVILAILKTVLNDGLLWEAIPFVQNLIYPVVRRKRSSSNITQTTARYQYTARDLSFIAFLIFLNNLIFPAIAILVVSSNCFYDAFVEVADVSLTYSYEICVRYSLHHGEKCEKADLYTITSSYSPPFFYSYQCASQIISTYAAVYILMFIMEGFVLPLARLGLKFLYDREQNRINQESQLTVKPSEITTSDRSTSGDMENSNSRPSSKSIQKVNDASWYYRILVAILPRNLHDLSSEPSSNYRHALALFDKNRLVVKLNAYLVVFMTFGVLFPPLALIACVSIISLTFYAETVIGRLFHESDRTGYSWYKKQIDLNCSGVLNGFEHFLRTLVMTACLVYSYLVFDTWADSEGWKKALPPSILLLVMPSLLLFAYSKRRLMYTLKEWITGKSNRKATKVRSITGVALSSFSTSNPIHQADQDNIARSNSASSTENHLSIKENNMKNSRSSRFYLSFQAIAKLPVFQPYDHEDSDDDEDNAIDTIPTTQSIGREREILHPRSSIPVAAGAERTSTLSKIV